MTDIPVKKDGGFAPVDYSDGRVKGEWRSRYEPGARKGIRWETAYLIFISAAYLSIVLCIIKAAGIQKVPVAVGESADPNSHGGIFLCALGALSAGALGGCSFGIKWMYHSVAKQIWHEDRRLWRLLSPHVSGIVSMFMVLLIASNLVRVFDEDFVMRPIAVIAFSFLVGYFSDKALAKMAEVADTLFGAGRRAGD